MRIGSGFLKYLIKYLYLCLLDGSESELTSLQGVGFGALWGLKRVLNSTEKVILFDQAKVSKKNPEPPGPGFNRKSLKTILFFHSKEYFFQVFIIGNKTHTYKITHPFIVNLHMMGYIANRDSV